MPNDIWKRPADDGEAMLFALRHPLRRQILIALAAGVSSPKQLSDRSGEELSRVAYHARALSFYGMIGLVDTTGVRGSVQHFYEATELGRRGLAMAEATGLIDKRQGDGDGES